jgi:hypothetical protein
MTLARRIILKLREMLLCSSSVKKIHDATRKNFIKILRATKKMHPCVKREVVLCACVIEGNASCQSLNPPLNPRRIPRTRTHSPPPPPHHPPPPLRHTSWIQQLQHADRCQYLNVCTSKASKLSLLLY